MHHPVLEQRAQLVRQVLVLRAPSRGPIGCYSPLQITADYHSDNLAADVNNWREAGQVGGYLGLSLRPALREPGITCRLITVNCSSASALRSRSTRLLLPLGTIGKGDRGRAAGCGRACSRREKA